MDIIEHRHHRLRPFIVCLRKGNLLVVNMSMVGPGDQERALDHLALKIFRHWVEVEMLGQELVGLVVHCVLELASTWILNTHTHILSLSHAFVVHSPKGPLMEKASILGIYDSSERQQDGSKAHHRLPNRS